MRAYFRFILPVILGLLTTGTNAQFQKPEDAVRYRQSVKFAMGQHFRHVADMATGKTPFNATVAAEHMAVVESLSRLPWGAFGPGTEKAAPHRAKPEVWSEPAKFKELSERMIQETSKLRTTVRDGNLEQLKASFAATAQTCRACHEANRAEKYSTL